MNETQCAVFQGIVYYYRANQVICRYQIALHDPVDPALLQRAIMAQAAVKWCQACILNVFFTLFRLYF